MSMIIKAYSCLLTDISRLTGIHLDLPDDFEVNWALIEGPKLDKQLLRFFEHGELPLGVPEWLKPLWDAAIDTSHSEKFGLCLKMLRTLLGFGYKAEFAPTDEQLQKAQQGFEEANQGVGFWNEHFEKNANPDPMFREARRLVSKIISKIRWSEALPSYGPGAVYPRRDPCEKGYFFVYDSIVSHFPYDAYFNCLPLLGDNDLRASASSVQEIVCRMVAVPKDSRGPRLICVHPTEAIWIQQGKRRLLERAIENHPETRGRINFRDQRINGNLALTSSASREYCTLDLKEASDRIGLSLVRYLFGDYAYGKVSCSRASKVRLLDDRLVGLQMFAPMGNCLTFPVESLVFWSLVRAGIYSKYGTVCTEVYVFGDDIIFPERYYDGAMSGLIRAGLIPNPSKTFRKGFFRESCGVDAFNGIDVTPYRLRVRGINSYSDAESACDLAKRLRFGGLCDTSAYLYSVVSKRFGRLSLTNNPNCSGLIEYVDCDWVRLKLMEPRLYYDRFHRWVSPYRRRARTIESIATHAWWHVQDSLLSLIRKDRDEPDVDNPFWGPALIESERGLKYPTRSGEELIHDRCEAIMK